MNDTNLNRAQYIYDCANANCLWSVIVVAAAYESGKLVLSTCPEPTQTSNMSNTRS